MIRKPTSLGRYKENDLSVFSSEEIRAVENLGFNLYRAVGDSSTTPAHHTYMKINQDLIMGAGTSPTLSEYSYIDQDVQSGISYWYILEDHYLLPF